MERQVLETTIKEIREVRPCLHDNGRSRCTNPNPPDDLDCLLCIRACILCGVNDICDTLKSEDIQIGFHAASELLEQFQDIDAADYMLDHWLEGNYPKRLKQKREELRRSRRDAEYNKDHYRI